MIQTIFIIILFISSIIQSQGIEEVKVIPETIEGNSNESIKSWVWAT